MAVIDLSIINQDVDDILAQLYDNSRATAKFKDFYIGSTGRTLLETQAAVGALNNFAAESALQESMLVYAKNASSIYANIASQGVRATRKAPAAATFQLTRSGSTAVSQTIPRYSQFTSNGISLFNSEAIVFGVGVATLTATLYEGQVVTKTVWGLGEDFQNWISLEGDFSVADRHCIVTCNNLPVNVSENPIWSFKNGTKNSVQDTTLPDGRMMLRFGNDIFGLKPMPNDEIVITYAVTQGTLGEAADFEGSELTFGSVTGVATSALQGAADEQSAQTYKNTGADLWAARTSAVTLSQYNAVASQFPGIEDVRVLAQRQLSTSNFKFMNAYKVVYLGNGINENDYRTYLEEHTMTASRFWFEEPVALPVNINVTVYIRNSADVATIRAQCQAAIRNLFTRRFGFINSDIYKSDITMACYNVSEAVKYVRINAPTDDIVVGLGAPIIGSDPVLIANPSSTLGPGPHLYAVCGYTGTYPSNYKTGELTWIGKTILESDPVSRIRITWDRLANADGYLVFGRGPEVSNMGILAQVAAAATPTIQYTDTGSATPSTPVPVAPTADYRYAELDTLTVDVLYSDRTDFNNR